MFEPTDWVMDCCWGCEEFKTFEAEWLLSDEFVGSFAVAETNVEGGSSSRLKHINSITARVNMDRYKMQDMAIKSEHI